jgi:hypothetical protein
VRALLASALLVAGCAGEEPAPVEREVDQTPAPAAVQTSSEATPTAASVDCAVDEEAIFSCMTERGKRIAVCGTADGKAEYRFGGDKPELVLSGGEWASVPYSGGGEAQIAFDNKAMRYVVFSRMVRTNFTAGEPNNPAMSDGVIVLEGTRVVGLQVCADPDVLPIQYSAADARFPVAADLFTWETGRADR